MTRSSQASSYATIAADRSEADVEDDFDEDDVKLDELDELAVKILASLMFLIGSNTINGKEKTWAIMRLRQLIELDGAPNPATVEAFSLRAGKQPKIARKLRQVHEGLLAGRTFLDYNRRPI